jgi:microcystin-dependent protein
MSEPFLGEIRMFGGNFAPTGWALCNGTLLSISQNQALFSILGTTFGGNGTTTFGLPDLQGRVPIHFGQGPGLSPYVLGQVAGSESVTLNNTQLPSHNHILNANSSPANQQVPTSNALAAEPSGLTALYSDQGVNTALNPQSVGNAGGNQPVPIVQPYLAVNFIIALVGIFPSRP